MSGFGSMHMCTVAMYPEAKWLWLRQNIIGKVEKLEEPMFWVSAAPLQYCSSGGIETGQSPSK